MGSYPAVCIMAYWRLLVATLQSQRDTTHLHNVNRSQG